MGILNDLKNQVSEMFEKSEDTTQIKELSKIMENLNKVEQEQIELMNNHKQLKADYVEAVKTSVVKHDQEEEFKPKTREELLKAQGLDKLLRGGGR